MIADDGNDDDDDEFRRSQSRLSLWRKLSYGVGHIFNDLCAALWFSYMLFYLKIILQINSSLAGILVMIGQIVDAFSTTLSGLVIDRYGRKKCWHFFGTGLVLISFPSIFSGCSFCHSLQANFIYFACLIAIFQIGWAIVQISHLSLIPIIANNNTERSDLTTIRYISAIAASVTVYLIVGFLLHLNDNGANHIGPQDHEKFRLAVYVIVAIGMLFTCIFYAVKNTENVYTKLNDDGTADLDCANDENEPNPRLVTSGSSSSGNNNDYLVIFKSAKLYKVAFLYVASRLYMTLNLIYMPLYLTERQLNHDIIDQRKNSVAIVPLFSYLASLLASFVLKFRSELLNNKLAYLIGSIVSLGSCFWIAYVIQPHTTIANIYFVSILIGVGSTTTMISSLCITAEIISDMIDRSALIYSTVTFLDKLICGIAVVIIEHNKCSAIATCPNYYRDVMSYVSSSAAIAGILVLFSLRN